MRSPLHAKLSTIIWNGQWNLGDCYFISVIHLRLLCQNITPSGRDAILWNNDSEVSVSSVYKNLVQHNTAPVWLDFIWHEFHIPRYAVNAWLVLQKRLFTKDRMLRFGLYTDPICVLCATHPETHSHLFSHCAYSRIVLNACPFKVSSTWDNFISGRFLEPEPNDFEKHIGYLFISAVFYAIWTERNNRIHRDTRRNPSPMISKIKQIVREKLYSCVAFRARIKRDPSFVAILY
nr:PREDICTED: uncharacterized protein LOC108201018 [Daucus carota subsp. sativus]